MFSAVNKEAAFTRTFKVIIPRTFKVIIPKCARGKHKQEKAASFFLTDRPWIHYHEFKKNMVGVQPGGGQIS